MLKHICVQLWNRRRANVWIFIELLLVSCLLWYIVDYFFVLEYNRSLPSHRDLNHTWQVAVSQLPDSHPEFQPGESDSTALEENYRRVLDRIRQCEGVEAIAVLSQWATPGGGSYWGGSYRSRQDTLRIVYGQMVHFDPRTDFFRVFAYTTFDGKPVSTSDFDLSDPKSIVINRQAERMYSQKGSAEGLILEDGSNHEKWVKGVVGDIKRYDYERFQSTFYIPMWADAQNIPEMEIAIRSQEFLSDTQFLATFKEKMGRELRIGNFYLKEVKSYNRIQAESNHSLTNNVRIRTALMLFFLVNIMLCVMGTFWYRIRVRREEIGLRLAMGSTRGNIRTILLLEGLALLSIAIVPAMLIEAQFVYLDLIETLGRSENQIGDLVYLPDRTWLRFVLTNGINWMLLALVMLLAIWLPANKAAKIAPAEALHDE